MEDIQKAIDEEVGVLLYFSTPACNVCKVIKPKLIEMFEENFPQIKFIAVDSSFQPEVAAQFSVFAAPTILLYLDKKEFLREGRNISFEEFYQKTKRIYELLIS